METSPKASSRSASRQIFVRASARIFSLLIGLSFALGPKPAHASGLSPNSHSFADAHEIPARRTPAFATSPEAFRAQIQSDVMAAIEKNRTSNSRLDYDGSGLTARDVFMNVKSMRNSNAYLAFCQSLEELPPESVALFEGPISTPEAIQSMPCSTSIQQKLTHYWNESRIRLRQHVNQLSLTSARKAPVAKPGTFPKIKLSSEERRISVSQAPTVVRGELKDGEIAFTFNEGPHPTRTLRILETLKAAGVRANFFHSGERTRKRPEIVNKGMKDGHTPGSVTFSHPILPRKDLFKANKEIQEGREEAESATGIEVPFFRFPYAASSPELLDILKKKKMPNFLWNMDSADWKIRDASALYDHVIQELEREKGGIILFHDVNEQTAIVLPAILEELKARGFTTIVFVPEP